MAKWRSARLRRLYGKPTDPIENSDDASAGPEPTGQSPAASEAPPPPPPKRVRREKTRPESEYELVYNMPVTPTPPDYSLLVNPLNEKQADTVAYAVHASRQNWLSGSMFETFWTRKPRGKKSADNQPNLRDKMTKLHECAITLGPHTFPVKLFTVKDDNVHLDEEEDRKIEAQLADAEKEKRAKAEAESSTPINETKGLSEVKKELNIESGGQATKQEDVQTPAMAPENHSEADQLAGQSSHKASDSEDPQQLQDSGLNEEGRRLGSANGEGDRLGEDGNENKDSVLEAESNAPDSDMVLEPEAAEPDTKPESLVPPTSLEVEIEINDEPHVSEGPVEPVEKPSKDPKATKGRRRGRPRTSLPKNTEASPPYSAADMDAPERKRSFEMEKQNLEAEKRRVEELEKRLNDQNNPYRTAEESKVNAEVEPATSATDESQNPAFDEQKASSVSSVSAPQTVPENTPAVDSSVAPAPFGPPRAVPNELVVSKLQQMAARDPTLGELMRVVASQTASHEDIMKFQEIINRVKASIFSMPTPAYKAKAKPKPKAAPQIQRMQPVYQSRAHSKAVMLAIEFDENPAERYLLPKRSIIEYVPVQGQLLWSFLHITEEDGKGASGSKIGRTKVYTPVTATFHDIPPKVAQTLERCVRKPELVAHYMKEIMTNSVRSEPWYLWYRIEKNDEVLLESIKKSQAPTMAPPPAPRKPMKPRKQKAQTSANGTSVTAKRCRPGEPLIQSRPMIIGRRGQPMVQPPSCYRQIQTRPRGPQTNRLGTVASEGQPNLPPTIGAVSGVSVWASNPSGQMTPQQSVGSTFITGMIPDESMQASQSSPQTSCDQASVDTMPPMPQSMQKSEHVEEPQSRLDAVQSKMEVDT